LHSTVAALTNCALSMKLDPSCLCWQWRQVWPAAGAVKRYQPMA